MAQLSPSELAIRKAAVQLNIDESIVEKVINYKWKSVHEAHHTNSAVEDSGLGTFKVRPPRVKEKINRLMKYRRHLEKQLLERTDLTETQRARRIEVLGEIDEQKQYLENKL